MKRFFIKKCTPQKEPNFHYHTNGLTWKIKQRDFHQKSHTCRLPNKVFSTRFYFVKKGGKESKNQHVQRPPDETDESPNCRNQTMKPLFACDVDFLDDDEAY